MNAIAVFAYPASISGYVRFQQNPRQNTRVHIYIEGLEPNRIYGLHVHQYGDLRNGCESLGPHFNPYNNAHGSREIHGRNRHVGDMINNVYSDGKGIVDIEFTDDLLTLYGSDSILGRSVILHMNADDLGIGHTEESHRTGNAGARIACAIIGVTNTQL